MGTDYAGVWSSDDNLAQEINDVRNVNVVFPFRSISLSLPLLPPFSLFPVLFYIPLVCPVCGCIYPLRWAYAR